MVSNDEDEKQGDSVKEIVKEIKMNPKKRKAGKDSQSKQVNKRLKKSSQEIEEEDDEYVL